MEEQQHATKPITIMTIPVTIKMPGKAKFSRGETSNTFPIETRIQSPKMHKTAPKICDQNQTQIMQTNWNHETYPKNNIKKH